MLLNALQCASSGYHGALWADKDMAGAKLHIYWGCGAGQAFYANTVPVHSVSVQISGVLGFEAVQIRDPHLRNLGAGSVVAVASPLQNLTGGLAFTLTLPPSTDMAGVGIDYDSPSTFLDVDGSASARLSVGSGLGQATVVVRGEGSVKELLAFAPGLRCNRSISTPSRSYLCSSACRPGCPLRAAGFHPRTRGFPIR